MFRLLKKGKHHKERKRNGLANWGFPRWWGNWGSAQITRIGKQISQITDWGRETKRTTKSGSRASAGGTTSTASAKRKFHRELRMGAGVAGATALLVFILFVIVFYGAGALRQFIEQNIFSNLIVRLQGLQNATPVPSSVTQSTSSSAPYIPTSPPAIPISPSVPSLPSTQTSKNVLYSTFYAGFSGTGWLNTDQTSLYRDDSESAMMFPSKFIVSQLGSAPGAVFPNTVAETEQACAGGHCLARNGSQLSFDGAALQLPAAVQGKSVSHVSIAALDSEFVVGVVTKDGPAYTGWTFTYGGGTFTQVFGGDSSPIVSKYDGVLGFGGTDSDWLAVYGAYDGQAVHVEAVPPAEAQPLNFNVTNVSQFFPIRVMSGGFRPSVISVNQPAISGNQHVWYVFSLSDKTPKLIKLWDNGTGSIQGATDLTGSVLPSGTVTALVTSAPPDGGDPTLYIRAIGGGGNFSYLKFIDRGFDKSVSRMVVSSNVNSYPWNVTQATISSLGLAGGGGTVGFAFSPDGTSWRDAPVGTSVALDDAASTRLFWRAVFTPDTNPMTSPFLTMVKIESQIDRPSQ